MTDRCKNITLAKTSFRPVKMEKDTGKVREFCQSGKVGTLILYLQSLQVRII